MQRNPLRMSYFPTRVECPHDGLPSHRPPPTSKGWSEATVTRSLETISGSFTVTLSEREPGATAPRPIRRGDACQLVLDGDLVITGWVDTVTIDYDANSHIDLREWAGRDGRPRGLQRSDRAGRMEGRAAGGNLYSAVRAVRYRRFRG